MMNNVELVSMIVFLVVFLGACGTGFFFFMRAFGDNQRIRRRLQNLSRDDIDDDGLTGKALTALPKLGTLILPGKGEQLDKLKAKFQQSGFYSANCATVFFGVKLSLLVALPAFLALFPYSLGLMGLRLALLVACVSAAAAVLGPNLWLEHVLRKRQHAIRRGLADGLDMLVLCLEGGLSLTAAFQRVSEEIRGVHGVLGEELELVQQTTQLGLTVGDAFKKFADRCGIEEVRELASVLLQSERFGASVGRALRLHADEFRAERQRRAEEIAQRAGVKIMFPLLLCIFPAIFVVLVGPAAFQIAKMFSNYSN